MVAGEAVAVAAEVVAEEAGSEVLLNNRYDRIAGAEGFRACDYFCVNTHF